MASLDVTFEVRTGLAVAAAKVVYLTSRPFTGSQIAYDLAWKAARRFLRYHLPGGRWQRIPPGM